MRDTIHVGLPSTNCASSSGVCYYMQHMMTVSSNVVTSPQLKRAASSHIFELDDIDTFKVLARVLYMSFLQNPHFGILYVVLAYPGCCFGHGKACSHPIGHHVFPFADTYRAPRSLRAGRWPMRQPRLPPLHVTGGLSTRYVLPPWSTGFLTVNCCRLNGCNSARVERMLHPNHHSSRTT